MGKIFIKIKSLIPSNILKKILPVYHFSLSFLGALIYRFPSRKIKVIAVTGTKGKTTTIEIINKILENAGRETSITSTLRFKIGSETQKNLYKMTMPGRFFLQKFLRNSVKNNCEYAIVEMTSEGARQFRHRFIDLNGLVFTNLKPEHIESHGSFENYLKAKLKITKALENSNKENRFIVSNVDDEYGEMFLNIDIPSKMPYSLEDIEVLKCEEVGSVFVYKNEKFEINIGGKFNIYNSLASIKVAEQECVNFSIIKKSLNEIKNIRGRVERIKTDKDFDVIVDYAHTPDSLEKLYEAFEGKHKICVLGNTGGGRDKWKRTTMAEIAEEKCDEIFLTNEDPYDEDPMSIVNEMKKAMKNKTPNIIIDRREAIREAMKHAKENSVVIISGKGTDPYIMKAGGEKEKWDDASVVREELKLI